MIHLKPILRQASSAFRASNFGCMMPAARRSVRSSAPSLKAPESESESDGFQDERPTKKRKLLTARPKKITKESPHHSLLFRPFPEAIPKTLSLPCALPSRKHTPLYHRPLLLDGVQGQDGRDSLLRWFDSVSHSRKMPWRKDWIDPSAFADGAELRQVLEERAYQVWISEIMLQQTRVATVIDYWNRWMSKWPTIHDLASASEDDVRSVWQGLGYYSRGTRILEAAKQVAAEKNMKGLLPDEVDVLVGKIPGVGRYTAGAICAIVFGKAVPMVDGNVLRVLSRQLGIFGDVQKTKPVVDTLWGAADALVKAAADSEDGDTEVSDVPGRWGQALMELGSTICTPLPNCGECPISSTCRAFAEGKASAQNSKTTSADDIEDACTLCEPFEDTIGDEDGNVDANADSVKDESKTAVPSKSRKQQTTLAAFSFTQQTSRKAKAAPSQIESKGLMMKKISLHAKRFPVRSIKKPVREEETLVCAIKRPDGKYLISQRPEKGLLAGLWELPSKLQDASIAACFADPQERAALAAKFVRDVVGKGVKLDHVGELGSITWLFSHIKLTMHVQSFAIEGGLSTIGGLDDDGSRRMWSDVNEIEEKSMGTGMRKCWDMVK